MREIPSRRFNTVFTGLLLGRGSLPPDFASQMCEIARRRVNTVFAGLLLGRGSLPPDFASRCVKSLTSVFMRYLQAFCLVATTSARFDQQMYEIPRPLFNAVLTGFLLGGGSLPPDFANRRVKSFNPCFYAVSTGVLFGYVASTY